MIHPELPRDSVMLLSVINTKLRDQYESLEQLCGDMQVVQEELVKQLQTIDYVYDRTINQFI